MGYFKVQPKITHFTEKHTAGELRDALISINGSSIQTMGLNHLTPVLDGETVTYTSEVFTLVYNTTNGYSLAVTKLPGTGYTLKGSVLFHYDEDGRPIDIQ